MSKIKLDDRIENAINAFFEAAPDRSDFAMTYNGNQGVLVSDDRTFGDTAGKWTGVMREILLFGPGTFFLYLVSIAAINIYPHIGLQTRGLFWIAAFSFMAFAGSGSIRKINNLAIPATVIVAAALVALLSPIFTGQSDLFSFSAIYVFPFVLIAAKLVQGWVSDRE